MDETKMKVLIMGLAICLPLIMINFANFPDTIHEAIKRDDFEAVEKFISMDQSLLNSKDSFGNTPLINAVKFGSPVMVDELMKYTKTENGGPGILDANIKDVFDESPLYIASKNGFDKIVGVFVYDYFDSIDFLASNGRHCVPKMLKSQLRGAGPKFIYHVKGGCTVISKSIKFFKSV